MDQDSEIYRFCAQHKEPAVVLGQAACCEVVVGALALFFVPLFICDIGIGINTN